MNGPEESVVGSNEGHLLTLGRLECLATVATGKSSPARETLSRPWRASLGDFASQTGSHLMPPKFAPCAALVWVART